jgi:hypothetical protein
VDAVDLYLDHGYGYCGDLTVLTISMAVLAAIWSIYDVMTVPYGGLAESLKASLIGSILLWCCHARRYQHVKVNTNFFRAWFKLSVLKVLSDETLMLCGVSGGESMARRPVLNKTKIFSFLVAVQ